MSGGGGGGGTGDIETVGDCTGPVCFEGTTGNALQFEGSTANGFETTLTATDPTDDRTVTLPNVTGTVALEQAIDARAYGVVCDGVTNDTLAIETAIAASNTTGAWVAFPAGTCAHTGTINPPAGASTIRVRGGPTTFSYSGSGWGWVLEQDYFSFEDVSLTIGASAKGMLLAERANYSTWDRGFLTLSAANPTAFGLVFHSTNGNYHQQLNALSFAGSPLRYNLVGSGFYNSNEITRLYCGTASPDACVAMTPLTAADFCVGSGDPYSCCTGAGTGTGTGLCTGDTEGGDGNLFTNVEMNNSASTDYAALLGASAKNNTFADLKCDSTGECINAVSTATGTLFVGGMIQSGGDATTKGVITALGGAVTSNAPNGLKIAGVTFSALSSDILNGTLHYCTDCQPTTNGNGQCTSGGTGSIARRLNGAWYCTDGVSLVGDCSGTDCFSASGTGGTLSFPTTSGAENRINFYDDIVSFINDYAEGSTDTYFKFGERSGGTVDPVVTMRNATGTPRLTIHGLGALTFEGTSFSTSVAAADPPANWTLTLPTTGGTNNYFLQTNGSGTTTWAQPDHGNLAGLSDDDHNQYTLKAGRAGTGNDTILSLAGTGTIYGSGATGQALTLRANDDDLTTGKINLATPVVDIYGTATADTTTTAVTADRSGISYSPSATFTGSGLNWLGFRWNPTMSLGSASSGFNLATGLSAEATVQVNSASFAPSQITYAVNSTITSTSSVSTVAPESVWTLRDANILQYTTTGTAAPSVGEAEIGLQHIPTVKNTSTGTFNWQDVIGFRSAPTISAVASGTTTIANRYGVHIADIIKAAAGGTETVTNNYGVDIAALSNGTTNIGLRNADTTVYVPITTTVGAAFTLTASETLQRVEATAARSSSTTTAINDGVADGQMFTIMNTDTTDNITVLDNANTVLGIDCVLKPGDTLTVIWDNTNSNWNKVNCSGNDSRQTKRMSATQALSSTTLSNITDLSSFNMATSGHYLITGRIIYTTSAAGADLALGFDLSSSFSSTIAVTTTCQITDPAAGASATSAWEFHSADATKLVSSDSAGPLSNLACHVNGYIKNGTSAGTLAVMGATNTAGTTTIELSSFITLERVS
jgi:hypothetical protein